MNNYVRLASQYGICGEQIGTETWFLPHIAAFTHRYHYIIAPTRSPIGLSTIDAL
jgi:hypothetical protein